MTMKKTHLFVSLFSFLALTACERKQTTSEKMKDTVNDALDRRPAEGVRDAAEDAKDAVKDAAKDTKDAIKDTTK